MSRPKFHTIVTRDDIYQNSFIKPIDEDCNFNEFFEQYFMGDYFLSPSNYNFNGTECIVKITSNLEEATSHIGRYKIVVKAKN